MAKDFKKSSALEPLATDGIWFIPSIANEVLYFLPNRPNFLGAKPV